MAELKKLQKNGTDIYPVTLEDVVFDTDGNSISTKYQTKSDDALNTTNKTIIGAINEVYNDTLIQENVKYTTANGIKEFSCKDGYIDNVVIEGETLVNLWGINGFVTTGQAVINKGLLTCTTVASRQYSDFWDNNLNFLKPSTTYTVVYNITKNTLPEDGRAIAITFEHNTHPHAFTENVFVNGGVTGLFSRTLTTKDDLSSCKYGLRSFVDNSTMSDGYEVELWMILLEGDHTDKPISYFEGLKSVGQGDKIEVLIYSVERFDYGYLTFTNGIKLPSTGVHTDNRDWKYSSYIKVNPNTGYLLKNVSINVNFYDIDKNIIPRDYQKFLVENIGDTSIGHIYIKTPSNCEYIIIHRRHNNTTPIEMYTVSLYDKKQIQTTLRSLPNGVKDTIEKRGNRYVKIQRCGEYTINENSKLKEWPAQAGATTKLYGLNEADNVISDAKPLSSARAGTIFCNQYKSLNTIWDAIDANIGAVIDQHKVFSFRDLSSKFPTLDSVYTYLKSNPIIVVYELETPIITELPNFNPQTFEGDTTLLINSGVIQTNADFEVTTSLGSEVEVLKDKISSLDDNINELFQNVSDGKSLIATAITDKGVETSSDDSFQTMADNIGLIETNGGNINLPSWYEESLKNKWISIARSTQRCGLTASSVGDNIYAIGGHFSDYLNQNYKYNTQENTWVSMTAIPTAEAYLTSQSIDNKIYCMGGYNGAVEGLNQCYDTTTDTWSSKTGYNNMGYHLTSSKVNNKIYVIGGFSRSTIRNFNYYYDPSTDTWSTKTNMTTARYRCSASSVGSNIYVIGGTTSSQTYSQVVECYDSLTDTWSTKVNVSYPTIGLSSEAIGKKVYVFGGVTTGEIYSQSTYCYDVSTDIWTEVYTMNSRRAYFGSAVVNNNIYVICGETTDFNKLNTSEFYIPN